MDLTLGHQARAAAMVRGCKPAYRLPRRKYIGYLPDGGFYAIRTGLIITSPSELAHLQEKERSRKRKAIGKARVRREKAYRMVIDQQAQELAEAAGPGRIDPAVIVEYSPLLRGVIKRLSEDVVVGKLLISKVTRARIECAVTNDRERARLAEQKAMESQSNIDATILPTTETPLNNHASYLPLPHMDANISTTNAPSAPTFYDGVLGLFVGKRKRPMEDENDCEGRATKKRVVERCDASGCDLDKVWMPGAFELRPAPSPVRAMVPRSAERPIAGTSRIQKRANAVGFSTPFSFRSIWFAIQYLTTATPVPIDLAAIERAVSTSFYMIPY